MCCITGYHSNLILTGFASGHCQVLKLLSVELPRLIRKYHIKSIVIPSILNTIDEEPTMKQKEAKREIGKMIKALTEISREMLVVTSIQREGRFADWFLSEFKKHINLIEGTDSRISV